MSKAFTSEESEDASVAGRLPERARPGAERPITAQGHRALVEERRRIARDLPIARASATGSDPRALEHRLALLDAILASVRVVEQARDGRVRFGGEVTVDWEDGRRQVVTIVGPDETDPKNGSVSIDSPLARALLGRGVGEEVELSLPRGTLVGSIIAMR